MSPLQMGVRWSHNDALTSSVETGSITIFVHLLVSLLIIKYDRSTDPSSLIGSGLTPTNQALGPVLNQ